MEPANSQFYSAIDPTKLCQGDIFECLPLAHICKSPVPVREVKFGADRTAFEFDAEILPSAEVGKRSGKTVLAACDFAKGILLNHGCDIDKPHVPHLLFAIIRAFPLDWAGEKGRPVRENRRLSAFYLPPEGHGGLECYVDFRRVTSISPAIIRGRTRLLALGNLALDGLTNQFVRFLTRSEINRNLTQTVEE